MPRGHSKDNAPSAREYRSLLRAAQNQVDHAHRDTEEYRLECEFVLRLMGELGMRAGEIAHMKEDWVDFERFEIVVPGHQECKEGKDGGPCGYCKKQSKQAVERTGISYEKAIMRVWKPKNEAAQRKIPYEWNDDIVPVLDEYLHKHGGYPHSRVSINRRVQDMAEESDMVNPDDIYPHAIRAYAAISQAKKGMRAYHLKEFMGWSDVSGAMPYIKLAAEDLGAEMRRIHSYR